MIKFQRELIIFLTIMMLICTSLFSVTTSKDDPDCSIDDSSVTPNVNNEYEIIIEKTVWNEAAWAEYAEVPLGDIVQFKGEVHNPNEYEIDFSGIIYDEFPDNLRYVNESCTLLDFTPDVVEEVDWENNNVTWHRIPPLQSGESHIFYFDATAVDCGLGINNLFTNAYVVVGLQQKVPVNDSDDATVNVNCDEPPSIEVEKLVWNGSCWSDYAEVDLGEIVQFKAIVHNPNEVYEIQFSGIIFDRFPDNLRYINGSSTIPTGTEEVDWLSNMVTWSGMEPIPPGDSLIFTFDATAVDCGIGINNLSVIAYVVIDHDRVPVNGSDEATVNVICEQPEANVSIEKYVKWDCTPPFKKQVDAEIGDFVIFKLYVNNTGDTPLDIVVVDELPEGLSYNDSANPEPDEVSGNTITWYFYDIQPGSSIIITFKADVVDCGELVNLGSVAGTFEDQIVTDDDTATVNVECPDEPSISVVKTVRESCLDEYYDSIDIELYDRVVFRINVTNTGEIPLTINVRDELPEGLTYENSATPREPDLIEDNFYYWYFESVQPQETITITFQAFGNDYGEHINLANVTGIDEQEDRIYDEDTATVNVASLDDLLEIGVEKGVKIGILDAFVKNNKEIDLKDISWDITVKNTGLFNKIDTQTTNIIEVLKPGQTEILKTESIKGFGRVEITATATLPESDPVTTTATGFVIGRIIFVLY